jgi:hypothetical protein
LEKVLVLHYEDMQQDLATHIRRLGTSGVVEMWRHITYDQCIEEELGFIGTPEKVSEQIRQLDQQIGGLNEMVIISNFGGIEYWKAIKTQKLFAKYVMPALREWRVGKPGSE